MLGIHELPDQYRRFVHGKTAPYFSCGGVVVVIVTVCCYGNCLLLGLCLEYLS